MNNTQLDASTHPLAEYIHRLERGDSLLNESSANVEEVVGILKSYAIVLDHYSNNLSSISQREFLRIFPFFKYFNGDFSWRKLFKHLWHDRINFEYAEYCMKTMFWHGGGGLDSFLDSPVFQANAQEIILAKFRYNPLMLALHRIFPDFLPEQIRLMAYYMGLGQFWRIMSDMFTTLNDRYERGEISTIADVVGHILDGLVSNANVLVQYQISIGKELYEIIPSSAGLTFLQDLAVPYVESIFFRGGPFPGTVSYNAQADQIPYEQSSFIYGALYADPLPIGGPGIPPTQLMQDMSQFLPSYLTQKYYQKSFRQEEDILVAICESFQKSMFCVTTAAIKGLAPFPLDSSDMEKRKANRKYLISWMNRLKESRIAIVNA
jgi:CO2 hydration protein